MSHAGTTILVGVAILVHIIYTHYNTGKAHLIDRDAAGYTAEGQKDNSSQLSSSAVPAAHAQSVDYH